MCLNRQARKQSFRQLIFLSISIFAAIILPSRLSAGQINPVTNAPPKIELNEEDLIHTGDVLDISVIGSYDYDWRGRLNPEGYLNALNYVDEPVFALCRSEESVAREIEKSYAKILKDPKVSVKIVDRSNRPVAELLGAVKNQQRFQIRRKVFLNELLIVSGGLTEKASGEVQIFRPPNLNCDAKIAGENKAESETKILKILITDLLKGDKKANPQIFNGDLITILEAQPVYVIGGVQKPSQIAMREKLTVSQAINSAGGIGKNGLEQQITVFRRENDRTKIIETSLEKIKNQTSEDFELKAYDIIEVGEKGGGKRKYPPVIQEKEPVSRNILSLPLRIID